MGPDYKINIIIDTGKICPGKASLKNAAEKTFKLEGIKNNISLNVLITGDKKIQELNRRFLGRNEPTDVISFGIKNSKHLTGFTPLDSKHLKGFTPLDSKHLTGFIGDIVISQETAERNSRRFNTSREKEIFLCVIHGILHLLGYRDKTKKEMQIMQDRQNKILGAICGES